MFRETPQQDRLITSSIGAFAIEMLSQNCQPDLGYRIFPALFESTAATASDRKYSQAGKQDAVGKVAAIQVGETTAMEATARKRVQEAESAE